MNDALLALLVGLTGAYLAIQWLRGDLAEGDDDDNAS